jgi:hypothetical protein
VARIISAYESSLLRKPDTVGRWEEQANTADTQQAAMTQLIYQLLVQVRVIKVVLIWVMVIVPIIGIVLGIVLANTLAPEPEPYSGF